MFSSCKDLVKNHIDILFAGKLSMDQFLSSFQGDSPSLQFLGRWGYYLYSKKGLASMYLHLILAALMPIYAGSHASLRCPPSATPPTEDENGEEIEVAPPVEGLQPSDAIVFPVLAGTVLAGLYYIIKWLEDAAVSIENIYNLNTCDDF